MPTDLLNEESERKVSWYKRRWRIQRQFYGVARGPPPWPGGHPRESCGPLWPP